MVGETRWASSKRGVGLSLDNFFVLAFIQSIHLLRGSYSVCLSVIQTAGAAQ